MAWLLFELELICTLMLAKPAVLGQEPLTLPLISLEEKAMSDRLFEAARSPAQNVVLVLKGVAAGAHPEGSWEVHVEPAGARPAAADPSLVGVISLFDRTREPAEFFFVLDGAIAAAGRSDLQVRFVPISGVVVDGRPQAAEVRSSVTIGGISLGVEETTPR